MATFTESTLRTRTRQMADMVNSTFVTDTELRDYLNSAISELHDIVVEKYEDYYVSTSNTMDLSSTDSFSLPTAFYKALGVDLNVGGNTYSLKNYSFQERNRHKASLYSGDRSYAETLYHIQGSNIKFIPSDGSGTATLYYVPVATQLSDSVTQVESIIPGYEEYIVTTAGISCLLKEESDVQMHLARKAELRSRIESAAGKRNAGDSYALYDVDTGGPYHSGSFGY